MEATPRPWHFDAKSEQIWSPEGLVAIVKQRGPLEEVAPDKFDGVDYRLPETDANGELIVRAVNSHDRLVEALEDATAWLRGVLPVASVLTPEFRRMEAALAAARGEGTA